MAPHRVSSSTSNNLDTAYSLSLLSEYTHTLDSLPLDLSRNFADLRELDAVLSSSMTSITGKIHRLTTMIEEGTVPRQERLWLLTDIAEEATRLKLGGEDKIRVACQAADNLKSHTSHIATLLDCLPSFDRSVLNRNTTYPHVAQRSFNPPPTLESGRRRRGGYGSLLVSALDPSPAKRRRGIREDELDGLGGRSPRKEKVTDHRSRNGARSKKAERATSPTDSVLSVTSHLPTQSSQQNNPGNSRLNATNNSSRTGNSSVSNKRARPSTNHNSNPVAHENDSLLDQTVAASTSRRDMFNTAPTSSSSHPSLPLPYGGALNNLHRYDISTTHAVVNAADWVGHPPATQLEGPGMPVARSHSHPALATATSAVLAASNLPAVSAVQPSSSAPADGTTEGEGGEGEGDDRTYCFCDGISYGEMIACDDKNCEREWFHLACIGLTIPPEGTWYCDACSTRRHVKRGGGRGGKRRAGGGRAGGKTANGA